MTVKAQAPSSLDPLLNLRDELTDRHLVLQGKFDDEIKRLTAIRDEAEEKLGMVETVAQAAKVKADADAYAAKVRADADMAKVNAEATAAQAKAALAAAQESDKRALAREAEATRTSAEFRQKSLELDATHAARMKAVSEREAGYAAREAKIQSDQQTLNQRQSAFDAKLASLKATTV